MSSDTNHRFLKYNCSLSVFLSTLTILIPILYMVFAFMSFKIQTGHPPKMLHSPTDTYITLLQISDLHISNSDENALENFQTICELLPTLTPDAVVATGDLCHGRLDGTAPVPHKYLDDYLLYNSTVNECLNTYNVPWFDLKGNHDVDGVYGRDSPKNFVDDFLHSGIPALGAAYIDITKDGTTVRIIGTDSYVNAMINIDTTGFLSTKNLNDVFDYLDNNNEYNVLATHHPTSWITTEGGNTFAQMINNHFEDNNPIDISVCGHFHMDSMSAYHHGFKEAELSTLQNEAYRIIVLKDGLAHYTDVHFGDLAVVPLCPSDSVSSCQHTSIWVENNVDGVTVETNNGDELILTQIDEHLWQSTESINDGDGEKNYSKNNTARHNN
ncbi:Ser/thr protein phosphatase family protein [Entamoeba marina]